MRDLKFRVWDNQRGSWAKESEAIESMGFEFGVNDYFDNVAGERMARWNFMQFTGLKDKNGVDIYEGDIVKHSKWSVTYGKYLDKTKEVYFDNELLEFGLKYSNELFNCQFALEFTVIGNIHENPELLNK